MSAQRLAELLEVTGDHPDLHEWLRQALRRYHEGEPLDRALGLAGTRAVRLRDAALRDAADGLDPKGQLSNWQRAARLAERIPTFERTVWPRYRDNPTSDTLGVNACLLAAFRAGCYVPRGQRQLHTILQNCSDDCSEAA